MELFLLIKNSFLLFASIAALLFVPGYTCLYCIPKVYSSLSSLERTVLAFGISIVLVDIIMILMDALGIPFTFYAILAVPLACGAILAVRSYFHRARSGSNTHRNDLFSFDKRSLALILVLLFLTVFVKTVYLSDTIFPTSTDLGHHMYWSELIVDTQELPIYEETNIVSTGTGYTLTEPEPIADFIIGEHLIFSAISILSGLSLISAVPTLTLHLVNVLTVFSLFILALRFFQGTFDTKLVQKIGIATLLFSGPLWAIASPQSKFVSGGVIGNLLGNLFIPLTLYCYFRALKEKNAWMLFLALLFTFGLFYTHHLSAFIFLFIFGFSVVIFLLFNLKNILSYAKDWAKMLFTTQNIVLLLGCVIFFLFVFTPSYLSTGAASTAVGGPSKSTRAGLSFIQLMYSSGELRMAFGIIGACIACWLGFKKRSPYTQTFLLGWFTAIFLMSFKPNWLFLDLPSGRIANYFSFPLMLLSGLSFALLLESLRRLSKSMPQYFYHLTLWLFLFVGTALFFNGYFDNASFVKEESNAEEALQTFHASSYLSKHALPDENIIKDHNYIVADVWMKVFFNNGYNYPFSRGFFKRYEDPTKPREQCTLLMISSPGSQEGQTCFHDLNTRYVVVSRSVDASQFLKLNEFWSIYQNDEIAVFYRK